MVQSAGHGNESARVTTGGKPVPAWACLERASARRTSAARRTSDVRISPAKCRRGQGRLVDGSDGAAAVVANPRTRCCHGQTYSLALDPSAARRERSHEFASAPAPESTILAPHRDRARWHQASERTALRPSAVASSRHGYGIPIGRPVSHTDHSHAYSPSQPWHESARHGGPMPVS